MNWISYIIIGLSLAQLMVALSNLIFNQSLRNYKTEFNGLVSVLIPARNEEDNIPHLLYDLQNQHYKNIEIIVFNDQSDDSTAEIIKSFAKSDPRIKLVNSEYLPEGWLGKNYACHSLSKVANGSYFLFLDADVRIDKDIIGKTIACSEKYKTGLLTIFPTQIMKSLGEKLTVPNMNFILLTLLPLILVRKSRNVALAAANGQYMLFNSSIYKKLNPHEKMKNNKVEDIEIARFYKKNKISVICITGEKSVSCRMYNNLNEAINGFSKNVVNFFGNSFFLALIFWMITTFGAVSVFWQFGVLPGIIYICGILLLRIIVSLISKQDIITNLFLLIPQQITLGTIIYRAFQYKFIKEYQWKGRNI